MTYPKKVLLVSCAAGSGHLKAAEALFLTLQHKNPEITVEHIDLIQYTGPFTRLFIAESYDWLIKNCPKIYGYIYLLSNNPIFLKLLQLISPLLRLDGKKFSEKIINFNPDLIVSTYFLPPFFLPKNYKTPLDVVMTDYQYHYAWLSPGIRNIFVTHADIKEAIQDKTKANIIVSGLPLRPDFFINKNIEEIKQKIGINNNQHTILIMPCNSGKIRVEELIKKIINNTDNKLNVLAIAGKNNRKLYRKIKELPAGKNNLITFDFYEKTDELMRISDLIITKAGGLTISECLHLKKPMILVNSIPGQEEHNIKFLEKNNYGLKLNSLENLNEYIDSILNKKISLEIQPLMSNPNDIILQNSLQILN